MIDQNDGTYGGDDLVLNPGSTCSRTPVGRHAGRWIPAPVEVDGPIMRTAASFLCKECGLSMHMAVSTYIPTSDTAPLSGAWEVGYEPRGE